MANVAETVRSLLADEPAVIAAYVFGSIASGHAHASSDIDVAVLMDERLTHTELFRLELELGARLEEALGKRVDLVSLNRATPFLAFQVLKSGILVRDRDPDTRSLFVMRALNTYYDMQRYLDYQNACALERFRQEA